MNSVVDKYYKGYEGEPEIQIIKKSSNNEKIVLKIWTGFFDNIMTSIEPQSTGWTSLAYYYNLYIGWYEESPWKIENLDEAKEQLEGLDISKLNEIDKEVLEEILRVFKEALAVGDEILISYE
ncbi:dihydroorotate dehydrogenase (quinone) [Clostridium sp. HBUAS56017]|uniref:dihydroorotate dehydrogenase (quinone) n=1 Tax=Clostridium sp. HBUAS56017 TaxID=2571128 RepID=UPI00117885E1|nr:dihydroorotate dehydrogenase (quinone) [Clostridium sp. HBUAS56017]